MKYVVDNYAGATPFSAVVSKVQSTLDGAGVSVKDCVVAASICSDEVNNSYVEGLGASASFFLGGLAGFPHTGLTGLTAYSHHIPHDGAAIILFGPHIGIDKDGTVGNVLRFGQGKSSNCCGALKLGLSRLNSGQSLDTPTKEDIQQYYIEQVLVDNKADLPESADQLKKATEIAYQEIEKQIKLYVEKVKGEFHGKGILLVGGIVINTDFGLEDYFDLKTLEYISL